MDYWKGLFDKMFDPKLNDNIKDKAWKELEYMNALCNKCGGEIRSRQIVSMVITKYVQLNNQA